MACAWKKPATVAPVDLRKIIHEQSDETLARKLQVQESPEQFLHLLVPDAPPPVVAASSTSVDSGASSVDEDELLAQALQQQFDALAREEARRLADPLNMTPVLERDRVVVAVAGLNDDDADVEVEVDAVETHYDRAAEKARVRSMAGEVITRQDLALAEARYADRMAELSFAEMGDPDAITHISSRAANALQQNLRKKFN